MSYHIKDEILVNSVSHHALDGVRQLERASKKLFAAGAAGMQSLLSPLCDAKGRVAGTQLLYQTADAHRLTCLYDWM